MQRSGRLVSLAVCTIAFVIRSSASADIIQTPARSGGHLISANGPLGQTFTAEDPFVIIGLCIRPSDVYNEPDHSLLVQLYQGAGLHGALLDSRVQTPADGFTGYYDVNYASVVQL